MISSGFPHLYTDDMAAALAFYVDLLGFTETFRVPADDPEHVELAAGDFRLGLATRTAAKRHQGIDAAPGSPALCLVMWTADLDAAFARLADAGAPVVYAPRDAGNGNRHAMVRDPDGALVELVMRVGRNAG